GSFREALGRSVAAAESRAKEAESLFGSIASQLDNHWVAPSHNSLPANQRLALKNFCKDLAEVATRHFDAYISGKLVSKIEPIPEPCRTPQALETLTYAKVARRPQGIHTENLHSSREPPRPSPKTQPQQRRTDDRLFVRIPDGDRLRGLSAYAIQSHLKAKLGNDERVLVNVQSTKTGFALCPKYGETSKLKEEIWKVNIFDNVAVESASLWTSYRINNVPRTFGTINDELRYCLQPVTAAAMYEALPAAAGTAPVAILASRDNEKNPDSSSTTWIVRFPETHQRLPRVLFLFGCHTITKTFPRRYTAAQCSRCWLWHNTQTCASSFRCRLCGSGTHTENEHGNHCAATGEHTCPTRYVYCHGPHAADDARCELKPKATGPPLTKAQVSAVRKVNADARMRRQAEAGCAKPLPQANSAARSDKLSSSQHLSPAGPRTAQDTQEIVTKNPFDAVRIAFCIIYICGDKQNLVFYDSGLEFWSSSYAPILCIM
ncbi:BgTH12-06446, partial [Blumeria graminis f. sp. triticale]